MTFQETVRQAERAWRRGRGRSRAATRRRTERERLIRAASDDVYSGYLGCGDWSDPVTDWGNVKIHIETVGGDQWFFSEDWDGSRG